MPVCPHCKQPLVKLRLSKAWYCLLCELVVMSQKEKEDEKKDN